LATNASVPLLLKETPAALAGVQRRDHLRVVTPAVVPSSPRPWPSLSSWQSGRLLQVDDQHLIVGSLFGGSPSPRLAAVTNAISPLRRATLNGRQRWPLQDLGDQLDWMRRYEIETVSPSFLFDHSSTSSPYRRWLSAI
jgi:hypothetical protein